MEEKQKANYIHIEEDGWVWVEKDGKETGLGDIDVDVFIKDKRGLSANK